MLMARIVLPSYRLAVEGAVLDGLREVVDADVVGATARSAMVRATLRMRSWARALRPKRCHRLFEQALASGVELAVLPDGADAHRGVVGECRCRRNAPAGAAGRRFTRARTAAEGSAAAWDARSA